MSDIPYFLIPELKYDRERLLDIVERAPIEWLPYDGYGDKGNDQTRWSVEHKIWYCKRGDYFTTEPYINSIKDSIKMPPDLEFMLFHKFKSDTTMMMHKDPVRTGVLIFPLTDDKRPLRIECGGEVIEVIYDVPIMLNAQCVHGLPHKGDERINMQFSYFVDFNEMYNAYKNGDFV